MLQFLSIMMLSAFVLSTGLPTAGVDSLPSTPSANAEFNNLAAGRKTVTAYADNETAAVSRAEKANPGWNAISAKKASKDPKSRMWQVTMTRQ